MPPSNDAKIRSLEAFTDESTSLKSEPSVISRTSFRILEGDEVGLRLATTVGPNGTYVSYSSGPQGSTVVTTLERVPNSGGHVHGGNTSDPLAVGEISPSAFTLGGNYPQNVRIVYRAPLVCGTIRCIDTVTTHSGETRRFETTIEIVLPGLLPIKESANLRLKAPSAQHPSPYWATPGFTAKLQTLASLYSSATGKPITVTDASLQWGGRFDLDADWQPSHFEHMNGTEADIRSNDMTPENKASFISAAGAAGLSILEEGNHWHVHG